jgi:hypothetical protein
MAEIKRINVSPTEEEEAAIQGVCKEAEAGGFPLTRMEALRVLIREGIKARAAAAKPAKGKRA